MSKRNAILAAATQLFSKNGFQGTVISDLSGKTGAATGTIFHHFKNKEDLFLQVLQTVSSDIAQLHGEHRKTRSATNGMEMVIQAVAFYLHHAANRENQFLLLHRHDPYQMAETNEECRNLLEEIYNDLLEIFEEGIRTGVKDGSIEVEDPRKSAMIVFAMVDGVVRLNTYRIYDAGTLYANLIGSCKRLLREKG
jgi:TetR/AcrR family fatty acid metabolism transcriptional regulator